MSEEEKLTKILTHVQDIKTAQAVYLVHQEQHRRDIDKNMKAVDGLKESQNKAIGFLSLGGIFGTAFFTWLFKQFSE